MRAILVVITMFLIVGCAHNNLFRTQNTNAVELKDLSESAQLRYRLGANYVANGEYRAAEEKLLEVLEEYPDFAESYLQLAVNQRKQGKDSDALLLLSQGMDKNPNLAPIFSLYAQIKCQASSDAEDALIKEINSAKETIKPGLYGALSACSLSKKDYNLALNYAEKGISENAEYAENYYFKAYALNELKRYTEVFTALDSYHDLVGYQKNSTLLGLKASESANNGSEITKYQEIINRYANAQY